MLRYLLSALFIMPLFSLPAQAQQGEIPAFSELVSLETETGWEPLIFPNIGEYSRYELVMEDGQQVVQATTDGGASGLIARLALEPGDSLILRWRWKVSNVYEKGDARRKDGDDYPARIYVAFRFEPDKASWFERAKRRTVSALFGEELPGNALNYIWANRLPEGEMVPNPFTDQTMMLAVSSGTEQVGQWLTIERDIVADYRRAFGAEPPALVGIAIMSDSDNTGESATAWYGDITLSRN